MHSVLFTVFHIITLDSRLSGGAVKVYILGQKALSACCLLCLAKLWTILDVQLAPSTRSLPRPAGKESNLLKVSEPSRNFPSPAKLSEKNLSLEKVGK